MNNAANRNETNGENFAAPQMTAGQAIDSGIRNWRNFNGRASRTAFWFFHLYSALALLISDSVAQVWSRQVADYIGVAIVLIVLPPTLAVGVRRLHDVNRSGWWMLFMVAPLTPFLFFTNAYWDYLERFGYAKLNALHFLFLPLWLFYATLACLLWLYWGLKPGKPAKNRFDG